MAKEKISVKIINHTAYISINVPESLNALNFEILLKFKNIVSEIHNNDNIHAVVITGAGDRSFVAGADIIEIRDKTSQDATRFSRLGHSVMDAISHLPQPVVAAVNGYALGAGMELALAADIRIASSKAVFGFPEVSLGIMPGFGGTQRLTHLIGIGKAKELIFTGNYIKADEAQRIGLVNKVVEHSELENTVKKIINKIISNSPTGVRMAKKTINAGLSTSLEQGLAYEISNFGLLFDTENQKEGMEAFLKKRPPLFK